MSFSKEIVDAIGKINIGMTFILESKTLDEIRDDLLNSFNKLSKPVYIFIDDIDRLNPTETAGIFQLIKTNANFPNGRSFFLPLT